MLAQIEGGRANVHLPKTGPDEGFHRVLWSFWVVWMCIVTEKVSKRSETNVIIDDFERQGSCGVPST